MTRSIRDPMSVIMLVLVAMTAASAGAQEMAGTPASQEVEDIRQSIRKVWLDNVQPLPAKVSELPGIARELRAMEIKPHKEAPPLAADTPAAQIQPATQPGIVEMSAEELERIKMLAASDLTDGPTLADDLYASGQLAAAAILYGAALKKQDPADKDWLEFQLGNCQTKADPAAAMSEYHKLAEEFPNSAWTPLAVTKAHLMQQIAETQAAASQPANKATAHVAAATK